MFQTKVVEKINKRVLYSITFFPENRDFFEIMRKNMVEPGRQQATNNDAGKMRFACRITTARMQKHVIRNTYLILVSLPWHQWSRERIQFLRYTYISCLVYSYKLIFTV
jgi:hypothetical protein